MPRLTDHHYLIICHRLQQLWEHAPDVFSYLTAAEQWQLHDYFQPSKTLTDSERLSHRVAISAEQPALPQQAGRALNKLQAAAASWAVRQQRQPGPSLPVPKRHPNQPMTLQVHGLVQPELDAQGFLEVLLDILDQPEDSDPPEPGHVEDHLAS